MGGFAGCSYYQQAIDAIKRLYQKQTGVDDLPDHRDQANVRSAAQGSLSSKKHWVLATVAPARRFAIAAPILLGRLRSCRPRKWHERKTLQPQNMDFEQPRSVAPILTLSASVSTSSRSSSGFSAPIDKFLPDADETRCLADIGHLLRCDRGRPPVVDVGKPQSSENIGERQSARCPRNTPR